MTLQTRLIVEDPQTETTASMMVDTAQWRAAGLYTENAVRQLLIAALRKRGGNPDRAVFTEQPVGKPVALVAVDGQRL